MTTRTSKPAAEKRPLVTPVDNAQRAIRRVLAPETGPGTEETPAVPVGGTDTERPVPESVSVSQPVERTFCFVDVSDFTAYTEKNGAQAATEVLSRFRSSCREVTGRRGVRLAKWLGDGAMLVGTDPGPVIAATAELFLRLAEDPFEIHAGVAAGKVLLFEGDDYIGKPVNLAARLCDAAGRGEMLSFGLDDHLPEWVERCGSVSVKASGLGHISDVSRLTPRPDAWSPADRAFSEPSAS